MFQIQPVRSRELQEQLAQAVGAPYYPDTFAFFAAELTDDAQAITGILGLCQFTYAPGEAVIRSVAAMPGSEDDEAIILAYSIIGEQLFFFYHRPSVLAQLGLTEYSAASVRRIRKVLVQRLERELDARS